MSTKTGMITRERAASGRPPATSHAAIESAAFALFAERGFDETTVEDIAAAVGIGRRTLFRYFPSKYDIPWGQFDASLSAFHRTLESMPDDLPVWDAVHRGVVEFNRFDPDAVDQHRQRMTLILRTPSLQAHSVLMYEQWRTVIADYVATRRGVPADSPLPRTVAQVSLALALSSYEQWLSDDSRSLEEILDGTISLLREYLDAGD
jgi:TetR/AcrR family transcriptional regulator, regulator of mycofactocin system